MPFMLVLDPDKKEIHQISECFTDYAAKNLADDWAFKSASAPAALKELTEDADALRLFCTDCSQDGLDSVMLLRRKKQDMSVVIIADASTSPLVYMRPSISASGLLMRPLQTPQMSRMFAEVFEEIVVKEREDQFGGEIFSVETRDGLIRIPYSKILYFEAREKRIVACTGSREYSFYSTLESLTERLPEYFLRCHKGFIANKLLVEKLLPAQGILQMLGGFQIPVSRSYKSAVKEAVR